MFMNIRGRGRIKTKKYRDWLTAMGGHLIDQKVLPITGPFAVLVGVTRPDRRKRDLDNMIKPILDLLTIHGLIDDDSLAQYITLEWTRGDASAGVRVTLTALSETKQMEATCK
jgi:crossover junction endodeoxyribonuclease RusA